MATTPGALGRRYAPFLIVAAVQVLLVAIVPSREAKQPDQLAAIGGPQAGVGAGASSASGSGGASGGTEAVAAGDTSAFGGSTAGGSTAGGGTGGGGAAGAGGGSGTAGATSTGGGSGPVDRSRCDKDGFQIGPSAYMPKCQPVWQGGDNGGATMIGVSATEIRYLWYEPKGDPQVNAILQTQGLAASESDHCAAWAAFDKSVNKRYEMYGRKAVAIDGPGANKGSTAGGCGTHFPHWQSQCSLTPPDPPCERAEAAAIAALKPAIVLGYTVADATLANELAKRHIVFAGGSQWQPGSYHTAVAPYFYDVFRDGELAMRQLAEYWCKKLVDQPVKYAGPDVMGIKAPPRKLGMAYPATKGDPAYRTSVNIFVQLITGGMCGSPKDAPVLRPYDSDITTAQTQAQTTVSALKSAGVTTVICFCDPIAPVFLTTAMDQQAYHPEHLLTGTGLIDYDLLGRLYSPTQWNHAFGPSELYDFPSFSETDGAKAWRDGGNTGNPDGTENLPWGYFSFLGTAIQNAGPNLTPQTIQAGLFNAGGRGGDPGHPYIQFGARKDDWTGIEDVREVWWSASKVSNIDGKRGGYVSVDGGKRYRLGQIPGGAPRVFQ